LKPTADRELANGVNRFVITNQQRIELDLGVVKNLAEVVVNGRSLGVLWKAPFRIDVSDTSYFFSAIQTPLCLHGDSKLGLLRAVRIVSLRTRGRAQ